MRHSFVSWDCCYRNFFHTAYALAYQSFDVDEYEVIYVEQRTEAASNAYNRDFGLPSLSDVVRALDRRINIRPLYVGDGPEVPFHWGRAVNAGIEASSGEVISVMDGDLLLDSDFLEKLDQEHVKNGRGVINLHRRMAPAPLGVPPSRWMEQQTDFATCLASCADRDDPLPDRPNNYGPMISARRQHWNAISAYDDHPIWASGLSLLGTDATRRLEIESGAESRLLPETVCVHPWHPVGFQRTTFAARRILSLQEALIRWAVEHRQGDWKERRPVTAAVYERNRRFVDRVMRSTVAFPSSAPSPSTRAIAWVSSSAGRLAKGEFRELAGEIAQAVRAASARNPYP